MRIRGIATIATIAAVDVVANFATIAAFAAITQNNAVVGVTAIVTGAENAAIATAQVSGIVAGRCNASLFCWPIKQIQ